MVRYTKNERVRKGVASTFLAERVPAGSEVRVFVHPSHRFQLPDDGDTPMIMVGPGTGIAPFRAFLEERQALGAGGKNWLFFGDQCQATDFLYQEELRKFQQDGLLTRLDIAFSRDQAEKIYVQDRMRERARELWGWLEEGAPLLRLRRRQADGERRGPRLARRSSPTKAASPPRTRKPTSRR